MRTGQKIRKTFKAAAGISLAAGLMTANTARAAPAEEKTIPTAESSDKRIILDIPFNLQSYKRDENRFETLRRQDEAHKRHYRDNRLPSCDIYKRFDTDSILSYESSDGARRLSLGGSPNKVTLKFKFKLNAHLDQQAHKQDKNDGCRYDSRVQGALGSAYNEFVLRRDNTVYQDLDRMFRR